MENEVRDKTEVGLASREFFRMKTKNGLCKYVGFVSTKKLGSMTDIRGRWDYTFIKFFFFSDVRRRYAGVQSLDERKELQVTCSRVMYAVLISS